MATFRFDRWWGLKNLEIVVEQTPKGMLVHSVHFLRKRAIEFAIRFAKKTQNPVAALSLFGNPHQNYKKGDILNPEDISWRKVNQCCSECCDNCKPNSLEYRCPLTKDHPLCDTVAAAIIDL